jgi:hypothetical protein
MYIVIWQHKLQVCHLLNSFATTANSKEEAIEQIKAKVASNKDDVNLVENSFGNLDEPEEFELGEVSILY